MLAEKQEVLRALHLPPESTVSVEPERPGVERWEICTPAGERRAVVLRRHSDGDAAANHAAVVAAIERARFVQMPAPLAILGDVVVEEQLAGVSALAVLPPVGSVEAAMVAIAALHALPVREGLRWELALEEILPAEEPPLHRLGFAAHERDGARGWFEAAHKAVLESPWGFVHGDCTAANVLLAPGRAWLASFHAAGFGPQVFDVAAFLLTAGLDAGTRREAAGVYATARGLPAAPAVDLIDLGGILWGVGELLRLPRRSIELLGDDASLAALNTAAHRVERGVRDPAGDHPAAAGIRAALWPA